MNDSLIAALDKILVFTLDELNFALPIDNVLKVIHAVAIRSLPKAPEIITGIINVRGQIIPVADIRKRLKLAEHEIEPDDRLIITDTGKRHIALLVDSVTGIRDLSATQISSAIDTLPFAKHLKGVAKMEDGMALIYNLDQFLSIDEEQLLDEALIKRKA
ncbi:MAG TPA: chemotaxis protein CheW [Bacteroidales bacterium]|nr:chemotaxis protein CheW [Bacteroidales bacterium]